MIFLELFVSILLLSFCEFYFYFHSFLPYVNFEYVFTQISV